MEKKFVASYSGGKDGVLSIYKTMRRGFIPLALITTYNTEKNRSWFHGIPESVLNSAADSIGAEMWLIKTSGEEYTANFEKTLRMAVKRGASHCVFGDIDIDDHIKWCTERCVNAGIEPLFPLYGQTRESVVNEIIEYGFTAHFTNIDLGRLDEDLLGKKFTKETIEEIKLRGADICGEHGEYHTFVSDGPFFSKPVEFKFGEKIIIDGRAVLPVENID